MHYHHLTSWTHNILLCSSRKWKSMVNMCPPYRRLHLTVNTHAKNMFSTDVKRLCFGCQTLKFSHPNVNLQDLKRLYFRCLTLNFSRPNVKFSWQSQCSRGSLSSQSRNMRKTCENHWYVGKFQSLIPEHIDVWGHVSLRLGGETSKFDPWNIDVWRQLKKCFLVQAFTVRCNRR